MPSCGGLWALTALEDFEVAMFSRAWLAVLGRLGFLGGLVVCATAARMSAFNAFSFSASPS
jgi:hypothetical protein